MARNPKNPYPTKKHLARLERERRQRRAILIIASITVVLVVAVLIYGWLQQTVLLARRPVAIVNKERISANQFENQVRYARYSLVQNARQTYQFAQLFGSDPSTSGQFLSQLQQIQTQLAPETVGDQVLQQMEENTLIRQYADQNGITVTDAEVEKAFEEAFGFYANGTPTPSPTFESLPTSTLSPLQMTLVPPTATPTPTLTPTVSLTATAVVTATATPEVVITPTSPPLTPTEVLTPTSTPAPSPTPTPYTLEGYKKEYATTIDNFKKNFNIDESALRYIISTGLYRQKVKDAVLKQLNVGQTEEEVWARHILVADEATAKDILKKLKDGADWNALAKQYSTDTSNKDNGGDLGWFPRGRMVSEFETTAFLLQVGETTPEPIKTQFGYHIIQVLGHENRPLSESDYNNLKDQKFTEWLAQLKQKATIVQTDFWKEVLPTAPVLDNEVVNFIQQGLAQQQAQPTLPVQVPQPTP